MYFLLLNLTGINEQMSRLVMEFCDKLRHFHMNWANIFQAIERVSERERQYTLESFKTSRKKVNRLVSSESIFLNKKSHKISHENNLSLSHLLKVKSHEMETGFWLTEESIVNEEWANWGQKVNIMMEIIGKFLMQFSQA